MQFAVVTLFPSMFEAFCGQGVIGRAVQAGKLSVPLVSPREFAVDKHGSVDDTPYGGGSGMVLRPAPIADALAWLDGCAESPLHRVLLTPQGAPFTQSTARRLATRTDGLALVCGRYEGFDERVRGLVHEELSLGDFVLTGGELAAMAVIDATARLLPGVLGNAASAVDESHGEGLLEYPQFTRPAVFAGEPVPEVLLSGDHARIARWRRAMSLARTRARRPDLFARLVLSREDRALLAEHDAPGGRA